MADQNWQQKSLSDSEILFGNTSNPSSADLPTYESSQSPNGRQGDSQPDVGLVDRLASLRQSSISHDNRFVAKSRKRSADEDSQMDETPKKKRKSTAARVIAKVIQTMYESSTVAFTTYQNYKDKIRNQITYRTSWQKEIDNRKMRGCGIDFIHFTESPNAMLTRQNSSNSLNRHKGKEAIQESRSVQSNANASPGPVIDSENWYWVTRDLKVSVVVSIMNVVAFDKHNLTLHCSQQENLANHAASNFKCSLAKLNVKTFLCINHFHKFILFSTPNVVYISTKILFCNIGVSTVEKLGCP
ncbi:hypothetical protein K450DRAFT_230862 [Umbelopsis ramanniana AG]|uniref:Uncharacterized protein n=1 Tax=Umbelopsis ramanniana AG TaxID=1314678 RepID=A0AAD5EE42_UMBRA|nr:uncharacterized protein K450DRAFT_230862 [Umbelopsis ramanniana AG]KAI8581722.1 hypothetical protein K450DRAFT_230862 [Umbelopsis ramanniana AG]